MNVSVIVKPPVGILMGPRSGCLIDDKVDKLPGLTHSFATILNDDEIFRLGNMGWLLRAPGGLDKHNNCLLSSSWDSNMDYNKDPNT